MNSKRIQLYIYLVLAVLLLVCLFDLPYGFYTLVRFLAMIGFAYLAYKAYDCGKNELAILFVVLCILFQPLLKITLGRVIWNIVDVLIAILLTYLFIKEIKEKDN